MTDNPERFAQKDVTQFLSKHGQDLSRETLNSLYISVNAAVKRKNDPAALTCPTCKNPVGWDIQKQAYWCSHCRNHYQRNQAITTQEK